MHTINRRPSNRRAGNEAVPNYRHAWLLLYALLYIPAYFWLEGRPVKYHVIETSLDRLIPFNEAFIIFYLAWFVFMAIGIGIIALTNQAECYRLGAVMIAGMTISCLIYYFYPTTFPGRPAALPDSGILAGAVGLVYAVDTSTNVLPSIHVYNTLAILTALVRCQILTRRRGLPSRKQGAHRQNACWQYIGLAVALVVGVLIILSTLFVKQHSVLDALSAMLLAIIITPLVHAIATRLSPPASRTSHRRRTAPTGVLGRLPEKEGDGLRESPPLSEHRSKMP